MDNKVAVVTGSYSGIGRELSRMLVAKGFDLVMINRNKAKGNEFGESLLREYPNCSVDSYAADLSVHQDIRDVAMAISSKYKVIDALFNNAGVLLSDKRMSKQENEMHFEVNTVAPFLLTKLLKPSLAKSGDAVVVTTGSGVRKMVKNLELDSIRNPVTFKKMTGPYAQSKLAISSAFAGLSFEYQNENIRLVVVDMGPVKTAMSLSDGLPGWMKLFRPFFSTPQKAAQKLLSSAFEQRTTSMSEADKKSLPDASIQKKLIGLLDDVTRQKNSAGT